MLSLIEEQRIIFWTSSLCLIEESNGVDVFGTDLDCMYKELKFRFHRKHKNFY